MVLQSPIYLLIERNKIGKYICIFSISFKYVYSIRLVIIKSKISTTYNF